MQRPILTYPDPFLQKKAAPVSLVNDRIRELVRDMFETMRAASGVGLAAPQIGVGKRVIVVDVSAVEKDIAPLALVNPRIVESRGLVVGVEGCLSIPGVEGEVPRGEVVLVKAQDDQGRPVQLTARGLLARALQHEIDHLDGILFIDRIPAAAAPAGH
ncbi:MAG: peptide deformylase [Deltaproteobacteria bacterium]|nr:peptide deformylase [Deltaproteobacteria bacterium]PWB60457.1 MAG: peptide deformylase [Deltaproteobacteria bacterium]